MSCHCGELVLSAMGERKKDKRAGVGRKKLLQKNVSTDSGKEE